MTFKLPLLVLKVVDEFQKSGFEIYIVGGSVRDTIMGKKSYDWDFTTNATPKEILEIFPDGFYDNQYGTVGMAIDDLSNKYSQAVLKNDEMDLLRPFEITTFRTEGIYKDRRHPDKVEWGKSIEEDLQRRDFTINAIALKVARSQKPKAGMKKENKKLEDYKLIDPYGGQKDIKNKLIRAVGDPDKRFSEDALRMMRAIRIASELGFNIEKNTLAAISKNWKLLYNISWERIRDELLRILKSDYPADGIKLLFTTNLLRVIIPELIETRDVQQAGHHTKDVWNHSIDSLANCASPDPAVRLATLLHDIGKPIAFRQKGDKITFYGHEVVGERICRNIAIRLKLAKKDKENLLILVRQHMFAYDPKMTDASIRRFIRKVGKERINDMIMLRVGDRLGGGSRATSWRLREFQQRIGKVMYTPMQITDLKINGRDIMKALDIKSGPEIGKILEKLFEEVLEDSKKNKKEYLLKRIETLNK